MHTSVVNESDSLKCLVAVRSLLVSAGKSLVPRNSGTVLVWI